MYNNYQPMGSPPLPDIIGQYYTPGYGTISGSGHLPSYDFYGGPSTSASYLYEPQSTIIGPYSHTTSPIRRRRYSIAGLPSATMLSDYYSGGGYVSPIGLTSFHQSSSSNILNLLNEAHKSISRSSQILSQHARMQQMQQGISQPMTATTTATLLPPTPHYPSGRVISSYPTLHPGDTSPPYLNDNLMQMSTNFSSQPNMYFQPYGQPAPAPPMPPSASTLIGGAGIGGVGGVGGVSAGLGIGTRLKPAYSVSNFNYLNYPQMASGSKYLPSSSLYGTTHLLYPQTLYNQSDPYSVGNLLQQRNLLASMHSSNPTLSQLYQPTSTAAAGGIGTGTASSLYAQQQQQQQQAAAAAAAAAHQQTLAYNIQQQFAGTQHYAHQLPPNTHPQAHIHASVQQQLNPDHQFHVHQQQSHLQQHPLAALANTTSPFSATLTSSGLHDHPLQQQPATATSHYHLQQQQQQHYPLIITTTSTPHHLHAHHTTTTTTTPLQHHHLQAPTHATPPSQSSYHHHHHNHHLPPYTKIDLDYPKLPQEHKRQVSFKFDVDTLSLDS